MKALCSYFDLFDKQLQYSPFYKYQFIKFAFLTIKLDFWITKEIKTKGNEGKLEFSRMSNCRHAHLVMIT